MPPPPVAWVLSLLSPSHPWCHFHHRLPPSRLSFAPPYSTARETRCSHPSARCPAGRMALASKHERKNLGQCVEPRTRTSCCPGWVGLSMFAPGPNSTDRKTIRSGPAQPCKLGCPPIWRSTCCWSLGSRRQPSRVTLKAGIQDMAKVTCVN
ncbi:hypothetical protein LY76DRAFT_169460 [Colletotrichum caudatum]|nr:hypothetical protein LY76DRAFT_169460 [Colletotrichum caudatum]